MSIAPRRLLAGALGAEFIALKHSNPPKNRPCPSGTQGIDCALAVRHEVAHLRQHRRPGSGECLLGDFGAASFHATADSLETRALQRIEVRAFGVLLGELLERIDTGLSEEKRSALEALRDNCCQPDVLARPGFAKIEAILAAR